jgi:hypothetical protein
LPHEARDLAATAGLDLVAESLDVASAGPAELVDEAPEALVGCRPRGLACRRELHLVLTQAFSDATRSDLEAPAELLHVGGTRVLTSRGLRPGECGRDDGGDSEESRWG